MRYGASCPALLYVISPVVRSITPMKSVTNMLSWFSSAMVSLSWLTMRWGCVSWFDMVRNSVRVTDMTSDAGMPFPLTSPMMKYSFWSRRKKS